MAYPGEGDLSTDDIVDADQLILSQPADRLPWLESDDDDGDDDGVDSSRIVAFALVGLLAVVVLVGALWWFTRDRPDPELVADGSTIEAPATPYKQRPANAGGTQVAGTGDKSFEVAEGRNVEGRIAGEDMPVVKPAIDLKQASATGAATPAPAAVSGVGVQVGAYSSREAAEAGWQQLAGRLPPLDGRSHRVVEGTADSGSIFRLQAVAGSVAEAEALCRSLRAAGGDCQVKR